MELCEEEHQVIRDTKGRDMVNTNAEGVIDDKGGGNVYWEPGLQ